MGSGRSLRNRGLASPFLAVGEGALGLWAAMDREFPTAEHQRCWSYRVLKMQSNLQQRFQTKVRRRLREMRFRSRKSLCEARRDNYVAS